MMKLTNEQGAQANRVIGRPSNRVGMYGLLVLFAVISFVFYHFVVFPLFLDYGAYGVFLTVFLLGFLLWLVPKNKRLYAAMLFIGYLLFVRGLYQVGYKPLWEQGLAFVCLGVVFYGAMRLITGRIPVAHILTLTLVGGLLFSSLSQEELFFAKKFQVLYKSPKLFVDTNVDYFPLQLIDITGDGQLEIVTQGFTNDELEESMFADVVTDPGRAPMQLEPSRYLAYHYSDGFLEIGSLPESERALWATVAPNYVGFPYYGTEWSRGESFIHRYGEVRKALLEQGMLQMDFFHQLEEGVPLDSVTYMDRYVEYVDNLWKTSSYSSLSEGAFDRHLPASVRNVDTTSAPVDTIDDSVHNSIEAVHEADDVRGVYELLVPQVDRLHLIQSLLPFGNTPFAALELSATTVRKQMERWEQIRQEWDVADDSNPVHRWLNADLAIPEASKLELITLSKELEMDGALILGLVPVTDDRLSEDPDALPVPELVVYRDGLEVYQYRALADNGNHGGQWQLVAQLTPAMLKEVADGEFLLEDISGDGIREFLLSASPSQVLRLVPSTNPTENSYYNWEQLWVANDDLFRFETVTDDGLILALSQSYKRNEARRYLTAYAFQTPVVQDAATANASVYAMKPLWRTNNTVINVRSGDVTGNGANEIVATYFRDHQFVVLREHGWPVQNGAWMLSGLGLLMLAGYRIRHTSFGKHDSSEKTAMIKDVLLGTVLLLLMGMSVYGISDNLHRSAMGAPVILGAEEDETETDEGRSFSDDEWRDYWLDAIQYTDDHGERFWYSGWVVTKVQKRRTNSMYDGIVVRDQGDSSSHNGFLVNARMLGQPFRYFESGDSSYISEDGMWKRLVNEAGYPVDWLGRYVSALQVGEAGETTESFRNIGDRLHMDAPFSALSVLAAGDSDYRLVGKPKIVGEETILGILCDQVVFTAEANFDNLGNHDELGRLRPATMEWTVWIGQEDPFIHQYQVHTMMPVPGAGMMQQTTYFRFWNYNDDSIQLTNPMAIERQIVEREVRQMENIEHALEDGKSRAELTDVEIRLLELRLSIIKRNVEGSLVEGFLAE